MTSTTQVQAERTIVLRLLRENLTESRQRVALECAASDIEPLIVNDALAQLEAEGVVILDGEQVWASACARHQDALGLIALPDRSYLASVDGAVGGGDA